jgi:hypothetical protein
MTKAKITGRRREARGLAAGGGDLAEDDCGAGSMFGGEAVACGCEVSIVEFYLSRLVLLACRELDTPKSQLLTRLALTPFRRLEPPECFDSQANNLPLSQSVISVLFAARVLILERILEVRSWGMS